MVGANSTQLIAEEGGGGLGTILFKGIPPIT
jgi:hypothetical protein